jgi:hypothetical protein
VSGRGPLHRTIRRPRINMNLQTVNSGSGWAADLPVGALAQYESRGAVIPEGQVRAVILPQLHSLATCYVGSGSPTIDSRIGLDKIGWFNDELTQISVTIS